MMVLKIIKSTREYADEIAWVLRPIPSFAFGDGVLNIAAKKVFY